MINSNLKLYGNMNALQKIIKNTGILVSTQIVAFLSVPFYMIHGKHYLGPEYSGILSFALYMTLIFSIFVGLCLIALLLQNKYESKKQAWTHENSLVTFGAYGESE